MHLDEESIFRWKFFREIAQKYLELFVTRATILVLNIKWHDKLREFWKIDSLFADSLCRDVTPSMLLSFYSICAIFVMWKERKWTKRGRDLSHWWPQKWPLRRVEEVALLLQTVLFRLFLTIGLYDTLCPNNPFFQQFLSQIHKLNAVLYQNRQFPASFSLFSTFQYLTVDWVWTAGTWNWMRLLYQLSHNHCPLFPVFSISIFLFQTSVQCDQIVRFIALWASFQSLWQQLFYPNHPHFWQFL